MMSWKTFTRTKNFADALRLVNVHPLRFITHGDEKEWKLNTETGEFTSPIALDGRIVSMKNLGIDRPILLPYTLETGTYTDAFSGNKKPITYNLTFSDCEIAFDDGNGHKSDIITTDEEFMDMEEMFRNSTFKDFNVSLMITRSWLNAKGMFRDTKKLKNVIFNECKFTEIDELFVNSDVEVVTLTKCSLDADFTMYTQLSNLFGICSSKLKRLVLNGCDEKLVSSIMYLYRNSDFSSSDFVINIFD